MIDCALSKSRDRYYISGEGSIKFYLIHAEFLDDLDDLRLLNRCPIGVYCLELIA